MELHVGNYAAQILKTAIYVPKIWQPSVNSMQATMPPNIYAGYHMLMYLIGEDCPHWTIQPGMKTMRAMRFNHSDTFACVSIDGGNETDMPSFSAGTFHKNSTVYNNRVAIATMLNMPPFLDWPELIPMWEVHWLEKREFDAAAAESATVKLAGRA